MEQTPAPEIAAQLNGLDAMMKSAFIAAEAPAPVVNAWSCFMDNAKRWTTGQPVSAPALGVGTITDILALIEKFRTILPEPFAVELEAILSKL